MTLLKYKNEQGQWIEIPILQGPQGVRGEKPVKGVDYMNAADIEEIKQAVLDALDYAEDGEF